MTAPHRYRTAEEDAAEQAAEPECRFEGGWCVAHSLAFHDRDVSATCDVCGEWSEDEYPVDGGYTTRCAAHPYRADAWRGPTVEEWVARVSPWPTPWIS